MKTDAVENKAYTLDHPDESPMDFNVDYLARIWGSSPADLKISIKETGKFKAHFENVFLYFRLVKDTLKEVILSQRKSLQYQGVYNAFVLGQLSEEEFDSAAKKFSYKPKSADICLLSSKISILFDATQIDYSPSELADLFQCNSNDISKAIHLLPQDNAGRAIQ